MWEARGGKGSTTNARPQRLSGAVVGSGGTEREEDGKLLVFVSVLRVR